MNALSNFLHNFDLQALISLLLTVAAVLLCLVIHEVSHGAAAYLLGDPTAKQAHRLSLNPLRHIDPIGMLMMIVVGFGWAKPVPVDMRYFKNPKLGMAITALAGPLSNFVLAYLALVLAYFIVGAAALAHTAAAFLQSAVDFCTLVASMSVGLGLFNLIPFPPLDGSKVVESFLPDRIYYTILRYERFGSLILMVLLWTGIADAPLNAARSAVYGVLAKLAQWPLHLLSVFA